jgi:hypothetical protein
VKIRLGAAIVTLSTFAALAVGPVAMAAEPALEPAVNTSAPATAPDKPAAKAADSAPQSAPDKAAARPAAPAARGAQDRIELDATQVTGNSELPRVLYVVPWKRSDLGDLTGRPVNSLLDEVLSPVDRDVFRRQNRYYEALRPDTALGGSVSAAPEGEK